MSGNLGWHSGVGPGWHRGWRIFGGWDHFPGARPRMPPRATSLPVNASTGTRLDLPRMSARGVMRLGYALGIACGGGALDQLRHMFAGLALAVTLAACGGSTSPDTCTPNCTNKRCGDNGCGGSCGSCSTGYHCSADFQTCESDSPSPVSPCPTGTRCFFPVVYSTCSLGASNTYWLYSSDCRSKCSSVCLGAGTCDTSTCSSTIYLLCSSTVGGTVSSGGCLVNGSRYGVTPASTVQISCVCRP